MVILGWFTPLKQLRAIAEMDLQEHCFWTSLFCKWPHLLIVGTPVELESHNLLGRHWHTVVGEIFLWSNPLSRRCDISSHTQHTCKWGFPKIGVPLNNPFNRIFHVINHLAIGYSHDYGNPQICPIPWSEPRCRIAVGWCHHITARHVSKTGFHTCEQRLLLGEMENGIVAYPDLSETSQFGGCKAM